MSFSSLRDSIFDPAWAAADVTIVGGSFQGQVSLDDISQMRAIAERALAQARPTIFLWDVCEATRAGTPEVRLASVRLRTDLMPLLELHETATLMVAPAQRVTRMLLGIIVKGMPRGSHIEVVPDLAAARARLEALVSLHPPAQRQAPSSP